MNAPAGSMTAQQAQRLVVTVTSAVTAVPVTFATVGTPGLRAVASPAVPLLLGAALLGLQLRHSLAAARGDKPAHGYLTFVLLAALVYLPLIRFGYNWASAQALVAASALMTLPGRAARVVAAVPIVGTAIFVPIDDAVRFSAGMNARDYVFDVVYWFVGLASLTAVVYGVTWLVRTVTVLRATHTELAELAIGHERLRISRDLHDLLGQSLSAVSLKGELALRLLPEHPGLAMAEVESLTAVAREALHGVRAVTRDAHVISFDAEVESASRLLEAAGVHLDVDLEPAAMSPGVEEVLAWAVREAATNVLRHSQASACSISTRRQGARVLLTIENDGAIGQREPGTGLTGLARRAEVRQGQLTAGVVAGARFRLAIDMPAGRP